MKTLNVWIREDGEPPCLLQAGRKAPGPGEVFVVQGAKTRNEAVALVRLYLSEEPDEERDGDRFLAWRKAQRRVSRLEVTGG